MAISFLGGLIFVGISFTPLRKKLIDAIPNGLKAAIGVGIGFFIAFVGLQNAGVIAADSATGVALGDLSDPNVLIAVFGILLIFVLYNLRHKINRFAFILAILGTAVVYVILSLAGVKGLTAIELNSYADLGTFKETFFGFIEGFKSLFTATPQALAENGDVVREGFSVGAKLLTLPLIVFCFIIC